MSVSQKIENGDYKTTVAYPDRPKKPVLGRTPTAEDARAYADAVEGYDALYADFKAQIAAYYADENAKEAQLRKDLAAEFDFTDHPMEPKLWEKAWEHGHSDGYHNVLYWYGEFSEVIGG